MQTIYLDISQKGELPVLQVKQHDVGRRFKAVITDCGAAYPIPADGYFSVWYSGTSGEGNYSAIAGRSAFSVSGNEVTVELIAQMLMNKGGGTLCLTLNRSDGSQIGLWNILYEAEAIYGADSEAAKQYFDAFAELAAQAIAAAETFTTDSTLKTAGKAADSAAVGAALAEKAPAGFGLGGAGADMGNRGFDNVKYNGFYIWSGENTDANKPFFSGSMIVLARSANYVLQIAQSAVDRVSMKIRVLSVNGWTEWEWINPPLAVGSECRTMERYNGMAVYCKLVDCGMLPNAATKTVEGAYPANATVIRHSGYANNGHYTMTIPSVDSGVGIWFTPYWGTLTLSTDADRADYHAYVTVYYTKA